MATDPTAYTPRYVTISAVPIVEDESYTDAKKREALFSAESELEMDVNDGFEIPVEERTRAHENAVLNLATHKLTKGAVSPSNTTLGDMADGGEQAKRHAETYLEAYERIVESIRHSDEEHGGTRNSSVSVNTRDPDTTEELYPYNEPRYDGTY
jgi:hypothetical protein